MAEEELENDENKGGAGFREENLHRIIPDPLIFGGPPALPPPTEGLLLEGEVCLSNIIISLAISNKKNKNEPGHLIGDGQHYAPAPQLVANAKTFEEVQYIIN